MTKLRCSWCLGIFPENDLIYTKDPDWLMCPLCREREPGFEEVKDNDS